MSRQATDSSSTPQPRRGGGAPPVTPVGIHATDGAGASDLAPSTLYRDAVGDLDPFGGMAVADYYRDPAEGYAPRYAPRNYVEGGAVQYSHPKSDLHYDLRASERAVEAHETELAQRHAAAVREALRVPTAPEDASKHLDAAGTERFDALAANAPSGTADVDIPSFFSSSVHGQGPHAAVPSWTDAHPTSSDAGEGNDFLARRDASTLAQREAAATLAAEDAATTETFHTIHSLRRRQAFEAERSERRMPQWQGYDAANERPPRHGSGVSLPRVQSPAGMAEAQDALRLNAVTSDAAIAAKLLAQNTNEQTPAVGPALAERISGAVAAHRRTETAEQDAAFRAKHGFGRQTGLVQDAGPDQRQQRLHKNDERLLRAAHFKAMEYSTSLDDTDSNTKDPLERQLIHDGVHRLIQSKFDVDRRAATLARGKQDPLERAVAFYGVPKKQHIDHLLRFNRGGRDRRSIEFYRPAPTREDMQTFTLRSDLDGFPMFTGRNLNPLEFDLFVRYRAHHQQRRLIALQHGLQPLPNETASERDARRTKLDELCEETPFDPRLMSASTMDRAPKVEVLRQRFGRYWLPSPTLVDETLQSSTNTGLTTAERAARSVTLSDATAPNNNGDSAVVEIVDHREHLLSVRYVNRIFSMSAMNQRFLRGYITECIGRAGETEMRFRQEFNVRKHFTPAQQRQYEEYVATQVERSLQHWQAVIEGKRYMAAYGGDIGTPLKVYQQSVVEVQSVATGEHITVTAAKFDAMAAKPSGEALMLDDNGEEVVPVAASIVHPAASNSNDAPSARYAKTETFVLVRLENAGTEVSLPEQEWAECREVRQADDPNWHLTAGHIPYQYNRVNYVETQDTLWEQRVAEGAEGWVVPNAADGLRAGLPVLARRVLSGALPSEFDSHSAVRVGNPERAVIVEFEGRPFYNPHPQRVLVRFQADNKVAEVPLEQVLLWQSNPDGPERSAFDETREFPGMLPRYVDYADPNRDGVGKPHFLDRYRAKSLSQTVADEFLRMRNIRDIDTFTENDFVRAENHRLLSSQHRAHELVSRRYVPRFTSWEDIAIQESQAPMIREQLRGDDVGPAFFHAENRYWKVKRRPYGPVKNFGVEVRDFFQYVDGVTPWNTAKKVRSYWETRAHHPIPAFNRPGLAPHRNTQNLLPASMWETDRQTATVSTLKDTIREYRPLRVAPAWSEK